MLKVEFVDNETKTIIQCNENDKFEKIIKKYCSRNEKKKEEMIFYYKGYIVDDQKTFDEIALLEDKLIGQMSIIINYNKIITKKETKNRKYILCPECYAVTQIDIKDYKIKLNDCKNNHKFEYVSFSDFNKKLLLDNSKLICDLCQNNNKLDENNKTFYICNNCNKKLCSLCKYSHDNTHNIIEFGQNYYKCNIHNDNYTQYCDDCKVNICPSCVNEHQNHKVISFMDIVLDKNKLEENKSNLRDIINKFKENINEIINKFNNIINNMEEYYNIYTNLIEEYDTQKRNYEILQNINNTNNYNNIIITDINDIINDKNIYSKFSNIMNIYYKIYLNKKYKSYDELKSHYENIINEIKNNSKLIYKKEEYENGSYEGEFKKDKREGKGIMYFKNGNKYEGEWKNDLFEGKGIMYFKDNDRYEGEFKNGKREGKGIYYYKNNNKYEGEWKNDFIDGKGIFYYNDGDRYEGEFKYGKREGKGIFYYKDSNRYEGDFKNGLFEGKGIFYYNNGNRYEGEFKKGKREGKGIMYFKNGEREMGDFLNDDGFGVHAILKINGEINTKTYHFIQYLGKHINQQ